MQKLVKYHAGGFDLACSPKDCLAVLLSESEQTQTINAGTKNEKTVKVKLANLAVFVDGASLVVYRTSIPHYDDSQEGKTENNEAIEAGNDDCAHAYWIEVK